MKYVSHAETNKMIRKCLKEAFPTVKFSVRKDGGSTNIEWTDGPTEGEVESVVKRFSGSYFDGMIDYQGSIYAELNGEKVRFGVDFIFCHRNYSDEALDSTLEEISKEYHIPKYSVEDFRSGSLFQVPVCGDGWNSHWNVQSTTRRKLHELSFVEPKESKTANTVKVVGSDDYGDTRGLAETKLNGYPRV